MNCKGIAFVETLLTVAIILIIAGSLIPLSYQLKSSLYNQKLELHASETALDAAKQIKAQSKIAGSKTIELKEFHWTYDGEQICVQFENLSGEQVKCINRTGD
ncbi:hypothetical protein M3649_17575 [Ureibacillus chungkukjangi]|uniref:Prepilin-type N-terminal cleavage/methylation domain-containing protein n=1 Tax=Ureibacillus chungkukjangi TaxID=1202712 RepID=A0A318TUY5_9BACL|nr:hypothetical protein [Ureibacillus chungkukjangi]MCM3389931.1 hypothetical protein [Ureibacillus chungkukjangi]PYF03489.1 hypothetical protein BJ095_13018 [Ureibacillus chungkukjangi]